MSVLCFHFFLFDSKSAELMATYKQNEKLLVIKETNNWYQVEDQDTGDVGFINKQFVVQ